MDSSVQPKISDPAIDGGENSTTVLSKRGKFLTTYIRDQQWSLPDSIIYYISKNPSNSKVYQKMIQSCKYFFIKNPLLVAKKLSERYGNNQWNIFLDGKNVDLNRVSSKLWITGELRIDYDNSIPPNPLPTILSKIYQSDVNELFLEYQKINISDLQFLASKCEKIDLNGITVFNEDDSVVGLEKIIEVLPKIKDFYYRLSQYLDSASVNVITPDSVQKLIEVPYFSNLESFFLREIPEVFDIDTFYEFIKKNKKTTICLNFVSQLSQEYQSRLQTIINEIIATQNYDYKVPYIYFFEIDLSSFSALLKKF